MILSDKEIQIVWDNIKQTVISNIINTLYKQSSGTLGYDDWCDFLYCLDRTKHEFFNVVSNSQKRETYEGILKDLMNNNIKQF